MSKLTLIGINNYMLESGDDLFLHLALPTGIDKESVIDTILMRGGEFEVLYPEPYFMRDSIITWSKKWYWTFNKWYKAINLEYNPLENYDRIETGTDTEHQTGTSNTTQSNTRTDNLVTSTSNTDNSTVENTVSAFDASGYTPSEKSDTDSTSTGNISNTGTQVNAGDIDNTSAADVNKSHELRIHGNIGVTTSQQMLQSELDIAMFNLYDKIADVFLQEYIIPIY